MRDLRAAIRNQPPVEHEYDWAPMHMPGSIQSYGALVVADRASRRVLFVSDNAAELLGVAPADLLDRSYLALTDSERERSFLGERIGADTILFPNPVRLTIKGRPFDAIFHAQGDTHQIEIEPVADGDQSYDDLALRATAELYDPPSIDELYRRAVHMVRDATGFDRVMLYRFDARYNGQVIAESTRDGIGSFLGLFFPSSDIGARARDLYLQNFTRYIPDIGARAHALKGVFPGGGQAGSQHPVDMSNTNLRSVVPCHITYLQNIGIKASMSFSINVDGKLWGLFACHHYAPRAVSYERRVVCEQTAMMFIYRLAQMSSTAARFAQRQERLASLNKNIRVGAALRRRLAALGQEWRGSDEAETADAMLARVASGLHEACGFLLPGALPPGEDRAGEDRAGVNMAAGGESVAGNGEDAALLEQQRLLLDLVEADSAAIVRDGQVRRIGDAPPDMAIYAIASMFGRELPDLRGGDLHVYATDCLSSAVPIAASIKQKAAGVMAVATSLDTQAMILWFRSEQIVHATWAGNPSADALSAGADGLNPRASFEAWKQDIRNLSRSWVLEDVQIADELATLLRELERGVETPAARGSASYRPDASSRNPAGLPAFGPPPTRGGSALADASAALADASVGTAIPATTPRRVIRIGQR